MHPLNDALPGSYVTVWVTHGAQVTDWYTYVPPGYRTSQCHRTFVPPSVSLWNNLADPLYDGGFQEQGQYFFYWPKLLYPY